MDKVGFVSVYACIVKIKTLLEVLNISHDCYDADAPNGINLDFCILGGNEK